MQSRIYSEVSLPTNQSPAEPHEWPFCTNGLSATESATSVLVELCSTYYRTKSAKCQQRIRRKSIFVSTPYLHVHSRAKIFTKAGKRKLLYESGPGSPLTRSVIVLPFAFVAMKRALCLKTYRPNQAFTLILDFP